MKKPIELDVNHLGSFITALMMECGVKEYTLSFKNYEELKLRDYAIYTEAEWSEGNTEYPDSLTVHVIDVSNVASLAERFSALDEDN